MKKRKRLIYAVSAFLIFFTGFANGFSLKPAHAEENGQAPVDMSQLPHLLITEIVPLSTRISKDCTANTRCDLYDYIELYNPTDHPINLKDYKFEHHKGVYLYNTWVPETRDVFIKPGKAMVVWMINSDDRGKTVADFNANYGTDLEQGKNIIKMEGYLQYNRTRDMIVTTNTGFRVARAWWNVGVDDTESNQGVLYFNKAIKYTYPGNGSGKFELPGDPSKRMVKMANNVQATPGSVDSDQVPDQLIHVTDDASPTIDNLTEETVQQGQNITIKAKVKDQSLVKTVSLFYKNSEQDSYQKVNLTYDSDNSTYQSTVKFTEFVGTEGIKYYFVATDGMNKTASKKYEVTLAENQGARLNVANGDILSGTTVVRGTSYGVSPENLKLLIDGNQVGNTHPALAGDAYFVYDTNDNMSRGFMNALTMDDFLVRLIDYGPKGTVVIPVKSKHFQQGENTLTLRSGDRNTIYYKDNPPKSNMDDYQLWNIRLVLPDGTVLRDPEYSDPTHHYGIGDCCGHPGKIDFTFNIASESLTAAAFNWNTTSVSDGQHVIKVVTPNGDQTTATVTIDNTDPAIQTSLKEGQTYKGQLTIDPSVTDATSGIQMAGVTLDGKPIDTPYKTSSAELAPGEHVLQVTAVDEAGNQNKKTVHFSVPQENPNKPAVVTPKDNARNVNTNPELKVTVSDPTNDSMDVTFYQGQRYTAENKGSMKIFKGATQYEPPGKMVPEGEKALTEKEYANLSDQDGRYAITDSTLKFPYQRFQVQLRGELNENDTIALHWEGKSLPDRKVTMYAWNYSKTRWEAVDSYVTRSKEDFTLEGNVNVQDYVRDNKVNVLIQDPPEEDNNGYTFILLPDTQYYSALHHDFYEAQIDWIINHQEDMNIKYVFHEGDIVDLGKMEYQWKLASLQMARLGEAGIPYGVLAGNHDVLRWGYGYEYYKKYFGADRFQDKPYYGGSYENNRDHYDLISAGGNDYMMVYLGWGVRDQDIAWANKVIAVHPDRKVILILHGYMKANGKLAAAGPEVYKQVVVPNSNVVAVFNGHFGGSPLHKVVSIDGNGDGKTDHKVFQMFSNYQFHDLGGQGYLRILHFDPTNDQIQVRTYSPYYDDYNFYDPDQYPGIDEFTVNMDLQPQQKRVATDYFEVNVYTHKKIGSVENVSSGHTAKVNWNGLKGDHTYYWYAAVEDNYGGQRMSDVWSFTTWVNLPVIDRLLGGYMDSGDIKGPLAKQLTNKLKQAQHFFYDEESVPKARKQMQDFLKLLNNASMEKNVSSQAKEMLNRKVNDLLTEGQIQ